MDLRQYFKKVKELEAAMVEAYPIVVSLETSDGGKPGMASEVSRANAAKLIAEGRAVLATEEQTTEFFERRKVAREAVEQAEMARRLQVTIVSEADLARLQARKNSSQQK